MPTTKRKTPRPLNISIYLGAGEQRKARIQRLERMAEKLVGKTDKGDPAVSKLIQKIADGEITLS